MKSSQGFPLTISKNQFKVLTALVTWKGINGQKIAEPR
jgi:hypothetical protein